mgnify:CR=1 FL=1
MTQDIPLMNGDFDEKTTIEVSQGSVQYDPSLEAYRLNHDWTTNQPLSNAVISVIEIAAAASIEDLPPLYDTIDPDGLDKLFAASQSGPSRTHGRVTFPYEEFLVTVTADGTITVQAPQTDTNQ